MSYDLKFHPAVRKDLRRIDSRARDEIISRILPELLAKPTRGVPLTGPLRGYWKYRVFLFSVWYRIAYVIDVVSKEIIVIAIGSRGEFYQRLQRRVGK